MSAHDDLDGQGPVWEQIRRALERKIRSGVFAPGANIPTEMELIGLYGASRMTVHRAVRSLAAEGLVERRRGRGTVVASIQSYRSTLEIWDVEAESRREGRTYAFELLERKEGQMRITCDLLNLPVTTPVLWTVGLHRADGSIIQLEERLTNLLAAPLAAKQDYARAPPGQWLLQNVPWSEAEHSIHSMGAAAHVAGPMGIAECSPCLVIERKTWQGQTPVTFARLWHPANHRLVARFGPHDGLSASRQP